ncbi:HipA family kinase [uncultured Sphingomonas sp.]|uniref:HipA family kinase n=1 Tax=uncultured Sphingomonas sp. TaxID=158754 RepID=UPI003458FB5A
MALLGKGWEVMTSSASTIAPRAAPSQDELFPIRATTVQPFEQGKDISFRCWDVSGRFFYCKGDSSNRSTRAIEAVFTSLALELGISTAPWSTIEYSGQTYFGSQDRDLTSSHFRTRDFILSTSKDETGRASPFPGSYLSQVLVYDLFINNPDRSPNNFVLLDGYGSDRLCAIDFADASFKSLTSTDFPVALSNTRQLGRRCREIHGEHLAPALEMVERIEGLPRTVFSRIVNDVRDDWLDEVAKGSLCEIWGSSDFRRRLAHLRTGLTSGDLV